MSDIIAVDVVIGVPPIIIDSVMPSPVAAIDVTQPEPVVIVVEPVVMLGGPPGPAGAGGATASMATYGSVTPITPGTTAYIGVGWSVTEEKAHFQVLQAGTVTDFGVSIGTALGGGTIVSTLRKNGVDTALVVTLSGADQYEYVSGSVVFAKGDRASIRSVVDASVSAPVIITPSWRLLPS